MNLQPQQYSCIGVVAKHCDLNKLCIAENEATTYDLSELFCDYWLDIEAINNEIIAYDNAPEPKPTKPDNYDLKKELLNGGFYLDCQQKKRPFEGIYSIFARYAYSRYVMLNGFNDTPNGVVQKTNEFSIPQDDKALSRFADKYRNMGLISFQRTVRFICQNTGIFNYDKCPTDKCGCGSDKCGGTKAKGYGFRSSNINK